MCIRDSFQFGKRDASQSHLRCPPRSRRVRGEVKRLPSSPADGLADQQAILASRPHMRQQGAGRCGSVEGVEHHQRLRAL
eukprot:15188421-Alexandrium_andersonii.AAC.1